VDGKQVVAGTFLVVGGGGLFAASGAAGASAPVVVGALGSIVLAALTVAAGRT